jgi:uncharacterized membrane-anchored protein
VADTTKSEAVTTVRVMLSKVPEITVWFWVIKILCTTVGESFADWINMTLGVGLVPTALIFTVALVAVLGWQLRLNRYVPLVYWLTVVVISVTGTLYLRERTLSIHSITTLPRELFYWLAVLVTFALGTAAGDWTLELTGWGPGTSVLLPAGMIVAIVIGWRLGANAVLSFWLAYILTRPLGANLGDWLGFPPDQQGLGWGVAVTSVVFLAAILATVVYLSITRADVIEKTEPRKPTAATAKPARERLMLTYYAVLAVVTGALLVWAAGQPHAVSAAAEAEPGSSVTATLYPGQSAIANFPPAEITKFRTIAQDTLAVLQAGDQTGATARIKDLETAWDDDQPTLQPMDDTAWTVLDGQIDSVLKALRAGNPDLATEKQALTQLLTSLK